MPPVIKEDLFPLVVHFDVVAKVGEVLVDGLKRVVEKERRWFVDVGASLDLLLCFFAEEGEQVLRPLG